MAYYIAIGVPTRTTASSKRGTTCKLTQVPIWETCTGKKDVNPVLSPLLGGDLPLLAAYHPSATGAQSPF